MTAITDFDLERGVDLSVLKVSSLGRKVSPWGAWSQIPVLGNNLHRQAGGPLPNGERKGHPDPHGGGYAEGKAAPWPKSPTHVHETGKMVPVLTRNEDPCANIVEASTSTEHGEEEGALGESVQARIPRVQEP